LVRRAGCSWRTPIQSVNAPKCYRPGQTNWAGRGSIWFRQTLFSTVGATTLATLALARIDVQAHTVADLGRRLRQIDSAIEEAAKRGRTATALTAIEGQRQREASTRADLKAERATTAAKGRQIETEAAPIRYVAELDGADADSERAIRWLIALMVLTCDPLAIALTAAASAGVSTTV
jgi:hypothetical protein